MRTKLSVAGIGVVAVLAWWALAAAAQGGVRVLESSHTVRFAERVAFHLIAESDEPIEGVTLYWRQQGEALTTRIVPDFTPGRRVEASYERPLERGEIPPGTPMEYYWRLDLASGARFDTDPQSFVYEDDRFDWQSLKAGQITVLYYGDAADAALAEDLSRRGAEVLERLQQEVGVTLEKPVRVYVYRNAQDMAAVLSPRSQGFDERVLTLGVAVGEDVLVILGGHPAARDTIAHELSHIVVGLATKNPYAPPPRWLDEGLAMYAQGELPEENAWALKEAIRRDSLLSVRSLSGYTGDPHQVDLYYGEVYSLVDFLLRTYGREKMAELLRVFKQGAVQEQALRQVYGLTVDELDAAWRESLGLGPRATLAPVTTAVPAQGQREPASQPCPTAAMLAGLGIVAAGVWRALRAA